MKHRQEPRRFSENANEIFLRFQFEEVLECIYFETFYIFKTIGVLITIVCFSLNLRLSLKQVYLCNVYKYNIKYIINLIKTKYKMQIKPFSFIHFRQRS